jgi:hypothetical protein
MTLPKKISNLTVTKRGQKIEKEETEKPKSHCGEECGWRVHREAQGYNQK